MDVRQTVGSIPWLVCGLVGLLATWGHITGQVPLDGLNPLHITGCATLGGQRRHVKRMALPPDLESGLTLRRTNEDGSPKLARFARGQILRLQGRTERMLLAGVDGTQRTLVLFDARGQRVDIPYGDVGRFFLTDGRTAGDWAREGALYGAGAAGIPGLVFLAAVAPCLLALGAEDELGVFLVQGVVVPAAAGAAVGAAGGALYSLVPERRTPGYEIHPDEWEIAGGRTALVEPTVAPPPEDPFPEMPAATAVAVELPPRAPDDPICGESRSFGLQAPPGCRCGQDAECASGLCGGVAPEGRCTSRCPLGCPEGLGCLVPMDGGSASCGVAP